MKYLALSVFALAAWGVQADESCARVHSTITQAGRQLYLGDLVLADNVPVSIAVSKRAELDIVARHDDGGGTVYDIKLLGMRGGQMQQLHSATIRTQAGDMPDFSYDLLGSSVHFVSDPHTLNGPCK